MQYRHAPKLEPNTTLKRFDGRFWTIDFPLDAIGCITSTGADNFKVTASYRCNKDLIGILWTTKDLYSHEFFRYHEDYDYRNMKLAFVANPDNPYNFNITVNTTAGGEVYRCYPYKVSGLELVPDVVDAVNDGAGPGLNFLIGDFYDGGPPAVPSGYHIYVVDFNNMKKNFDYSGDLIDCSYVINVFLSLTDATYGWGTSATLRSVTNETLTQWTVDGVLEGLKLTAGDQLIVGYTQGATFVSEFVTVNTWSGDGTTTRYVDLDTPRPNTTFTGAKVYGYLQNKTPIGNVDTVFEVRSISCIGPRSDIPRNYRVQAAHGLQIATGFDDTYNLTPIRQVEQTYALGYRGRLVCYMGMSHYFKASSFYASGNVYQNKVVDTALPLNASCVTWCQNFFALLKQYGFGFVWSTSYEILYSYCPDGWEQQDYLGAPALSGYTPPSTFIRLTLPTCLNYLVKVIKQGGALLAEAGIDFYFQIGEPWWWDGSYSNGRPCVYDPTTTALYLAETGLNAPTTLHNIFQDPLTSAEEAYCDWLGVKLGDSTGYIRDQVKLTYTNAKCTLLFFTPQIFNFSSLMLRRMNFPSAQWSYPYYDFVQIEDYDWIIAGEFEKLPLTIEAAIDILHYPINLIDYFVGFVFVEQQHVWDNMNIATDNAVASGIKSIAVWAYPQIIRDSIFIVTSALVMPSGIEPTLTPNGYAHSGKKGLVDGEGEGGALIERAFRAANGKQEYSVSLHLDKPRYRAWCLFYHFKLKDGSLSFAMNLDSGGGMLPHDCFIVPGSYTVSWDGASLAVVQFTVLAEGTVNA